MGIAVNTNHYETENEHAPYLHDLISSQDPDHVWFAFEFFPPKTDNGTKNLFTRFEKLRKLKPLYIDFTWGAGGRFSDKTIQLSKDAQDQFGFVSNMHITCTEMSSDAMETALVETKNAGIMNILVLRGDPPVCYSIVM